MHSSTITAALIVLALPFTSMAAPSGEALDASSVQKLRDLQGSQGPGFSLAKRNNIEPNSPLCSGNSDCKNAAYPYCICGYAYYPYGGGATQYYYLCSNTQENDCGFP